MTLFDALAEKIGDEQWDSWKNRVLDAKEEIADFVATRNPGHGAEVLDWFQGSFNFCLQVMYDDGTPDAIIRFPGPGRTTFRDEKIVNEVHTIQFFQENTTIPVPRIISWGLTEDSPQKFGPFIISEFVEGTHLSDILSDPSDKQRLYLDPKIDESILNNIYEQIADFLLQLYKFDFDRIGAISKLPSTNRWAVTGRPLTYSMNELATTTFFPLTEFPETSFATSKEYFQYLIHENQTHLLSQRNLCGTPEEAEDRYITRFLFAESLDKYCQNDIGPFKLFCDDFRPQNILIDPMTFRIKAVLDLEFTNAMPSQYASEPPWWLLLAGPDSYVLRGHTIQEFTETYEPRLCHFLQVMEKVEREMGFTHSGKPLSSLMRESWSTKQFWFNYAARKPFDVEILFSNCLIERGNDLESLTVEARQGLEPFVMMKMEQLKAYDADCAKKL